MGGWSTKSITSKLVLEKTTNYISFDVGNGRRVEWGIATVEKFRQLHSMTTKKEAMVAKRHRISWGKTNFVIGSGRSEKTIT